MFEALSSVAFARLAFHSDAFAVALVPLMFQSDMLTSATVTLACSSSSSISVELGSCSSCHVALRKGTAPQPHHSAEPQ